MPVAKEPSVLAKADPVSVATTIVYRLVQKLVAHRSQCVELISGKGVLEQDKTLAAKGFIHVRCHV